MAFIDRALLRALLTAIILILGGCWSPPGMTLEQYERQRCRTDSPPPDCARR